MMNQRRTCTSCGQTKPLEAFYRNHHGRSGYATQCPVCQVAATTARQAERRLNPPPQVTTHDLTAEDLRILAALATLGAANQFAVWEADHLRCGRGAVRTSLRRLVEAGLARYDPACGKGATAIYIHVGTVGCA